MGKFRRTSICILAILLVTIGFVSNLGAYEGVLDKIVGFYQEYLSPFDMSDCPSYPRCSEYLKQVINRHGFIKGWILMVDRLFHEGSEELKVSRTIIIDGKIKIFDPPENNDFWWFMDESD